MIRKLLSFSQFGQIARICGSFGFQAGWSTRGLTDAIVTSGAVRPTAAVKLI